MLKEIHEQADAVAETLADRLLDDGVDLGDIGISDDFLRDVRRVVIVACGTSYHAGLVGRYAIEWWSRVPVEMDIASEFRYRNPVLSRARPRDRHLAVGRDRRHAGRHAAGARARRQGAGGHERHGQPGHARRGRRDLHARRPRDRRGGDQDVRGAGGRDAAVRAEAGRPARHARAGGGAQPGRGPARDAAPDRRDGRRDRRAGAARSPSTGRTPASSSTWAATSGCRSASRAR